MRQTLARALSALFVLATASAGCNTPTNNQPDLHTDPVVDLTPAVPFGTHKYSKLYGNASGVVPWDVAAGPDGSVVVTGGFDGMLDLGSGALNAGANSDIFVAKYGPDGTPKWSKSFGGAGATSEVGESVAIDPDGNVIVVGTFRIATLDFGGGKTVAFGGGASFFGDVFVAKFDGNGTCLWAKRIGGTGEEHVTVALAGRDIVVAGYFDSAADLGDGVMTSPNGGRDGFISRFGPDGTNQWAKRFGSNATDRFDTVATDATGNIYVTGTSDSAVIDLGSGTGLAKVGGFDVIVGKYSPTGQSLLFGKRFGGTGDDYAYDIAVATDGAIAISGEFNGSADFGKGPLVSQGADAFVAKLNSDGSTAFQGSVGGSMYQAGNAVAFNAAGELYLFGSFDGALGTAGLPAGFSATSKGGQDTFLVKYDATGQAKEARSFGGTGEDMAATVVPSPGALWLLGQSGSPSLDFGGGATTGSTSNFFLANLAP